MKPVDVIAKFLELNLMSVTHSNIDAARMIEALSFAGYSIVPKEETRNDVIEQCAKVADKHYRNYGARAGIFEQPNGTLEMIIVPFQDIETYNSFVSKSNAAFSIAAALRGMIATAEKEL